MSYGDVISELESKLVDVERKVGPLLETVETSAGLLNRELNVVRGSWSGSWTGYHASLYYRDFERPSAAESFNPSWGPGRSSREWNDKTSEAVVERVEARSKTKIGVLTEAINAAHPVMLEYHDEFCAKMGPIVESVGGTPRRR